MAFLKLLVKINNDSSDEPAVSVCSPGVGLYRDYPEAGSFLLGGRVAGRLTVLNQTYDLVLPPDGWGQVTELAVDDNVTPVEYGQVLFQLVQRPMEGSDSGPKRRSEAGGSLAADGTHAVKSPTDGIFYARANPGATPYVSVGDRVTHGQTLGLVEVMKSFNPIQYGGAGLPEQAEIVEILVQDGAEIKAEQVLFLVRE